MTVDVLMVVMVIVVIATESIVAFMVVERQIRV